MENIESSSILQEYKKALERFLALKTSLENNSLQEALNKNAECQASVDCLTWKEIDGNLLSFNILTNLKNQLQQEANVLKNKINDSKLSTQETQKKSKNVDPILQTSREAKDGKNKPDIVENCLVHVGGESFCKIAGLGQLKKDIRCAVILPLVQPQLYQGLQLQKSILLYGPPGTGKTKLAKATAAEANAAFLSVTSSSILSCYLGQSEKAIHEIFKYASNSDEPIILFFDEIDALCRQRTEGEAGHSRRLKTEILCQMDNLANSSNGFLICATNSPWELDTAFKRRFQRQLYVPLPNDIERHQLLKLYTKGTSLESTEELWEEILKRTEGYSGSDIERLVTQALMEPVDRLQQTKLWKLLPDGSYEPHSAEQDFENVVVRDIEDLPSSSVRKMPAIFNDFLTALELIKPTVSQHEVEKFTSYSD